MNCIDEYFVLDTLYYPDPSETQYKIIFDKYGVSFLEFDQKSKITISPEHLIEIHDGELRKRYFVEDGKLICSHSYSEGEEIKFIWEITDYSLGTLKICINEAISKWVATDSVIFFR